MRTLQRAAYLSYGMDQCCDPVTALVVGGTALVGSAMSANAAKSAANTQAKAANRAADAQMQQFYTINDQQAPYREAGYTALNELLTRFGSKPNAPDQSAENFDTAAYLAANPDVARGWDTSNKSVYDHYLMYGRNEGRAFTGTDAYKSALDKYNNAEQDPAFGSFLHQFDANDLKTNLSPNYDFMLNQGLSQARNQYNSTGGLISGNALQGLNTFAQNYAQNAYQQAYENYNTNQTNIYNRLASIAGLGQTANQSTGQLGLAATQSANDFRTSAAAASAAGNIGQANAISGGLNNISDMYAMYKLFGKAA